MVMADPLSLLRHYKTGGLEIIERDNQIIFGESSWPKDVKTRFRSKTKDKTKEYYTLECLLYFLKNYDMTHLDYFNKATAANIQAVRRPDRKKMLQYLFGEIDTCASIDQGTLDTPTQLKRSHNQEDDESNAKKPRVAETSVFNVKQKKNKKKKNKNKS